MVKFEDIEPGEKFHSGGVNYTKLLSPREMTNHCKNGTVNARHKGQDGIVQFVFVDEAKLVEPGHTGESSVVPMKVLQFPKVTASR